jgi:hypothetical protein
MSSDEERLAGSTNDGVDSRHEHDGQGQAPQSEEHHEDVGNGGNRLDPRYAGGSDLSEPARPDSGEPAQDFSEGELLDSDEATAALVRTRELPRIVLGIKNDVQNIKNELHLHASQFSVQELRELREFDVRAYEMQLRRMERQHEHDLVIETASVERPGKIATRGQYLALLVVLSVLALAAYALYLHEPWLAGVLGAIDLIGLASVFNFSNFSAGPPRGVHSVETGPARQPNSDAPVDTNAGQGRSSSSSPSE